MQSAKPRSSSLTVGGSRRSAADLTWIRQAMSLAWIIRWCFGCNTSAANNSRLLVIDVFTMLCCHSTVSLWQERRTCFTKFKIVSNKKNNNSKGQNNLSKGDIARMQKKSFRYLPLYSPGGSTRRKVGPAGCSWNPNFGKGVKGRS